MYGPYLGPKSRNKLLKSFSGKQVHAGYLVTQGMTVNFVGIITELRLYFLLKVLTA